MSIAKSRRKRLTVDLAVGRRWWLLPIAAISPLLIASALLRWTDVEPFDQIQFCLSHVRHLCEMVGAFSTGYVAAILNCRGAWWRHRLTSIVLLLAAAALLAGGVQDLLGVAVGLGTLAMSHLGLLRVLRRPSWRIRPCSRRMQGFSIGSILLYTAAVAILLAAGTASEAAEGGLAILISSGLVAAVGAAGQLTGALADWDSSITIGTLAGWTLLIYFVHLCLPNTPPGPQEIFLAVSAAFLPPWAISFIHRWQPGTGASSTAATA